MAILPLWAVHIGDVLSWPWILAGFVVAGLLAGLASWRLHEEEVPRIALLTAAFFVASSIHVKCGPTSVHMLLAGLTGVLLGWRAPLAIVCGVTLQALLVAHGGLSTIGVNACVQAIPALVAGGLFYLLRDAQERSAWLRHGLLGVSALAWAGCVLLGVALVATQSLTGLVQWDARAGLVLSGSLSPTWPYFTHPVSITFLVLFPVLAVGLQRWFEVPREFALGLMVGTLSVLLTLLLLGGVLVLDGADQWGAFVSLVFVAHLPLALLEGVLVGMTVSFLARVKPEMLGVRPTPVTVAVLVMVALGGTVSAHGLEASYSVDAAARTVSVTVYYETGEAPQQGTVKVTSAGETVAEGETDSQGRFSFTYQQVGPLLVSIRAEGGHSSRFVIHPGELEAGAVAGASQGQRLGDIMSGVALVLALAALVTVWLNNRRLRRLEEKLAGSNS